MISKEANFPAIFKRTQFPIIPAYFLTFNRAQGQSLQRSGLELPESVFSHGQLYVCFSRNGDPNQVFVHANQHEFMHLQNQLPQDHFFTRNVVYKEIFQ
jgi:ATP-dependent DNA helicase PIF1